MKTLCRLLIAWLFASAANSFADPEVLGAQYKCDTEGSSVSFAAYDEGWFNSPRMPAYKILPIGSHVLRCATKHGVIRATIRVLPPSNGECRGSGSVYIAGIAAGGKNLITRQDANLNFSCPSISNYFLSRLDVKLNARSATVRRCISDALAEDSHELGCTEESVGR